MESFLSVGKRLGDALGGLLLPGQRSTVQECMVADLPDDQLVDIFRRLPIRQRLIVESVCTRWRDLIRRPELWSQIELADAPDFSAQQVARLVRLSGQRGIGYGLQVLDLSGCYGTDVGQLIPILKHCPGLQRVRAVGSSTGRPLVTAESLPDLVALGAQPTECGNCRGGRQNGEFSVTSSLRAGQIQENGSSENGPLQNGFSENGGRQSSLPFQGSAQELRPRQADGSWQAPGGAPLSNRPPADGMARFAKPRAPAGIALEVDLEVDWSTAEEYGETTTQLSAEQWKLVFDGMGGGISQLTIRALYIEVFAAEVTWPRLLNALRGNTHLRELYLVCLHCEIPALRGMLAGLADTLEGDSCLEVLQVKYAEFRSVEDVRPLVRLCTNTPSLRRLEVVKCNYEMGAEVGLAEILKANPPLEELVSDAGSKAVPLAAALAENSRLKVLRLRGLVEAGAVALGEAIKGADALLELDLREMMVTPGGLAAIAAGVQSNTSLTCLRLDYGDIDYFLPTEEILEGMEAVVTAVRQRGGMDTLGLSVPDAFWPTSSQAPYLALPKRFFEPSLAALVKGPRPLVQTLHITTPWEDWHAGDAAAWRVWFNLSPATQHMSLPGEVLARKREVPRKGVVVQLVQDSLGEVETWETHAWIPEAGRHVPHLRTLPRRLYDLALLLVFPLVHLWQSVDSMYHVDCSGWNLLDWIFIGPLACFRTLGLVAGLLTLYLVMYTQSIIVLIYDTAKRSVLLVFGILAPARAPPKHPLRTPEGHRLLRNMV